MLARNIQLIVIAICFLLSSCNKKPTSGLGGVVDLSTSLPVSKTISVCWNNLAPTQLSCKTDLENALIREFGEKTTLQLSFNSTCDGTANVEIQYQRVKHVNSRIETSGRIYSLMEIICGDFSTAEAAEIRSQCRSAEEAKICNINIGLHEFGHAIGLSHEDLRPESPTGSEVYDDDKLVILNKFDHKSIMHFGYYRNIVGTKVVELTEGDIEAINKLYDQDLKIPRTECTKPYRFDDTSGLCFIGPTNGQ